VVRDVTERIQSRVKYEAAETLRREAHQRLLEAIDVMTDGFALFDSEDRLQVYNQRYVEDVWGCCADYIRPGLTFKEMVEYGVRNGLWEGTEESFESIAKREMAPPEQAAYPRRGGCRGLHGYYRSQARRSVSSGERRPVPGSSRIVARCGPDPRGSEDRLCQ
jgi:hypothetical protein